MTTSGRQTASVRYAVEERQRAGQVVVVLRDTVEPAEVEVLPGLGLACLAFRVGAGERQWPVLVEPPDDAALLRFTTRYGIPILYPWPNRIRGGHFTFQGRAYTVPVTDSGNAIHGIVRERAWTVEATGVDDGAFCRASVAIGAGDPSGWTFPTTLTLTYRLHGRALTIDATATNDGERPMPMGFGLHPYFPLPLGPLGTRAACEVHVPADEVWELESHLPTGTRLAASAVADLREWRALDGLHLDDVYTGLHVADGWFTSAVRDPASGRSVSVSSDAGFREHVVFAPPTRDVVALEPYTCLTDAFNLAARGLDVGEVVLEAGQRWSGRVVIRAEGR
ncbi:MAG: aldose 1-epimerase [Chloroflexi bacterium]|nr:aldose 1-epimerase [Chloroflexota bacterium]